MYEVINPGDHFLFHEYLDQMIPQLMRKHHVPGTAVSMVSEKDKWVKCFGLSDVSQKRPIHNETLFQAGSISKTITAWGVMKLVEDGCIHLDEPINNFLTRWKLPLTKFNPDHVTIRRLLNHTAGISTPYYLGTHPDKELDNLLTSLSNKKAKKAVSIIREPGKEFQYSGGGYTLLQLMIEEVTRQTFSQYMKESILNPLGMHNSTFDLNKELSIDISLAYSTLGNVLPNYLFIEKAAAGLYTNISDISRFLEANLYMENDNLVLKHETLRLMHKRHIRMIPTGLGYFVQTLPNNNKIVLHSGVNRGWNSIFIAFPSKCSGIAILTNSSAGMNLIAWIARSWLEWVNGPIPKYYYKVLSLEKETMISLLFKEFCANLIE